MSGPRSSGENSRGYLWFFGSGGGGGSGKEDFVENARAADTDERQLWEGGAVVDGDHGEDGDRRSRIPVLAFGR
jgi:hypothetical protein